MEEEESVSSSSLEDDSPVWSPEGNPSSGSDEDYKGSNRRPAKANKFYKKKRKLEKTRKGPATTSAINPNQSVVTRSQSTALQEAQLPRSRASRRNTVVPRSSRTPTPEAPTLTAPTPAAGQLTMKLVRPASVLPEESKKETARKHTGGWPPSSALTAAQWKIVTKASNPSNFSGLSLTPSSESSSAGYSGLSQNSGNNGLELDAEAENVTMANIASSAPETIPSPVISTTAPTSICPVLAVSTSPKTGHASSPSSPPTAVANPAPSAPTPNASNDSRIGTITAPNFANLVQFSESFHVVLDCRPLDLYQNGAVKHSLHVPPFTGPVCHRSRLDVVSAIVQECPHLLETLHGPGYFNEILIYDEASTAENMSPRTKQVADLLTTWNANTRTKVLVLDGGFQAIENLPVDTRDFLFNHLNQKRLTLDQFDTTDLPNAANLSEAELFTLKSLEEYLRNLESAIKHTQLLLHFRKKLKSYEAIKTTLLKEERRNMEEEVIRRLPQDLQNYAICPRCEGIYTGAIFQCKNGHCCCAQCHLNSSLPCPECDIPVESNHTAIRNRWLEQLLFSFVMFRVDCIFKGSGCPEKLPICQLPDHLKVCQKRTQCQELMTMELYIAQMGTELVRVSTDLKNVNLKMVETEKFWNIAKQNAIPSVPQSMMKTLHERSTQLFELKLQLQMETFWKK